MDLTRGTHTSQMILTPVDGRRRAAMAHPATQHVKSHDEGFDTARGLVLVYLSARASRIPPKKQFSNA